LALSRPFYLCAEYTVDIFLGQADHGVDFQEVFLLLLNFWLVGQFSEKSFEKQAERLRFIRFMLESIGIDILSDELMEQTLTYLNRS